MIQNTLKAYIPSQPNTLTAHITKNGADSAMWGEITGNIENQTDLIEYIRNTSGDKFFEYTQLAPATRWAIEHPLDKFPSVTVVDSGGSVVIGEVEYIDNANIVVTFQSAFAGKAYLN